VYLHPKFLHCNLCSPQLARRKCNNKRLKVGPLAASLANLPDALLAKFFGRAIGNWFVVVINDLLEVVIGNSLMAAIDNLLKVAIDGDTIGLLIFKIVKEVQVSG
jgi:hypothetical protein